MGLFPLPGDVEPFHDKVLSTEGNIFEECTVSWSNMKRTILKGLWLIASDLEGCSTTEIPQKTILEVAEAVEATESKGVRVEWIGLEIGRILRAKDLYRLAQNINQLRERIVILQQQLDKVASKLGRPMVEMSGQGMDPTSSGEYTVHFF